MVVYGVFSKKLCITYKNTLLSKATLLVIFFNILSVILPLIVISHTKGVWKKRDVFTEQPKIRFKREYIFLGLTSDSERPIITCSTFPYYEEIFKNFDTCAMIKVREEDTNFDSKTDNLHVNLKVNLPNITLETLTLLLFFNYKLEGFCPVEMETVLIYQQILPRRTNIFVNADTTLIQTRPVVCNHKTVYSGYNASLIPDRREIQDYDHQRIISRYLSRNLSLSLSNLHSTFVPVTSDVFILDLKIRFPENLISYETGFWDRIKWFWIQYYMVFITFKLIFSKLKMYIFSKRLVLFYEENPLKHKTD